MSNLLFVSYGILDHLPNDIKNELLFYENFDKKFWTGTSSFSHARYGKDYCPWDIQLDNNVLSSPSLESEYNFTFADISDSRSRNLIDYAKSQNKRLGIFWSGGIDSTVSLVALIKNLTSDELSIVDVFMNHYSIIEAPMFFDKVIKGKLNCKIVNSKALTDDMLTTHIISDGEPADKLWLVQIGLTFAGIYGVKSLQKPFLKNTDTLIEFMSLYMPLDDASRWYSIIEDNIREYAHFVETTADFFSWINFNFHASGHMYSRLLYSTVKFQNFVTNYKPWYSSQEYQKWAWGAYKRDKNAFTTLSEYKMIAKKYIFDLTKDEYFLNFKIKTASINPTINFRNIVNLMILSDGTTITKDDPNFLNYVQQYLK